MKRPIPTFEEALKEFTTEELAWDFHCNIGFESAKQIALEARNRGINLCRITQVRRGGPFVNGWSYHRPACNRQCKYARRGTTKEESNG